MRSDTIFTNTINASWDERSRRGLTTITSFGIQALLVGVLLILPLLRPSGMPLLRPLSTPVSLGQPVGDFRGAKPHAPSNSPTPTNPPDLVWRQPSRLPNTLPSGTDDNNSPPDGFGPSTSGLAFGDPHGLPGILPSGTQPIMPIVAPPPAVAPIHISHMNEGNLIHQVLPTYPPLARSARIEGSVVLQAVISKQGAIENLRVISGHPMLTPAAIEAVRQWRYRPYILNDQPLEVETQITVNFFLNNQ